MPKKTMESFSVVSNETGRSRTLNGMLFIHSFDNGGKITIGSINTEKRGVQLVWSAIQAEEVDTPIMYLTDLDEKSLSRVMSSVGLTKTKIPSNLNFVFVDSTTDLQEITNNFFENGNNVVIDVLSHRRSEVVEIPFRVGK